ncbi:hypothetical protein AB0G73_03045 [Streptomyces sp. NPDC020719]|uniref:hypothetical protein n=1 Tax=unclassified Streptomyces TaxID=2593676 RepID=UPI0033D5860A
MIGRIGRTRFQAASLAAAATLTAAPALLGLVGAPPAAAEPVPTPATATVPAPGAQDRVDTFLTAYRNARLGTTEDATPAEVRGKYLTKDLDQALTTWAATHKDADPVFRAPNVPASWTLKPVGTDGSHLVVTEKWGDGTSADVAYTVRPGDLMITAIADPPAIG